MDHFPLHLWKYRSYWIFLYNSSLCSWIWQKHRTNCVSAKAWGGIALACGEWLPATNCGESFGGHCRGRGATSVTAERTAGKLFTNKFPTALFTAYMYLRLPNLFLINLPAAIVCTHCGHCSLCQPHHPYCGPLCCDESPADRYWDPGAHAVSQSVLLPAGAR